ncbi:fasciclin domain-containing protein [Niabella drilacis]|uniref:Fasciclin domain-containing protein n=1 Tax=Niabella drilacis (strain DSM 25811 / CCM 8410 / CCUG 62505 / LMG 26954 / E90) TaxID=1285928 RepID=A0A1G6RB19_NIADE|nr:fasciclin domain-containing protein [Niabella drilacis]SDD01086.1 Fasciclin domain-containing protein [Niabella drilacis]
MNTAKYYCILCLLSVLMGMSCKKDNTYRNDAPEGNTLPYNVYEYLQKQGRGFDSLLFIINRSGLRDTLASQNVTFFIPSDASISSALINYNSRRSGQGLGPVALKDIDSSSLRQLLAYYIARGSWMADAIAVNRDGIYLRTVGDRTVNVAQQTTNAEGVDKGGSQVLKYSFTYSSKWEEDWSSSRTSTTDIRLSNGVVHVLEPGHIFGFGTFHIRAAERQNYWSDYYYYSSGTLYLPNATTRPWGPLATAALRNGKRVTAISANEVLMDGGDFIGNALYKIKITLDSRDSVTAIGPATAQANATLQKHGPSYFDRDRFTLHLDYQYDQTSSPAGRYIIIEEVKLNKN